MRRALLLLLLLLLGAPALAAPPRLHLQPSREQLLGDGDDRLTLTVTARDEAGEVRTDLSGPVRLSINAGRLSDPEPRLQDGVAVVELTAPILDDQNKVFQRSIQLTQKILEGIQGLAREGPPGSPEELRRRIGELATRAAQEGPSAAGMTSVDGSRPEVLITALFQGGVGKARIPVQKVPPEAPGRMEGFFRGRDVTGSTEWTMELSRSGGLLKGRLFQTGFRDEVAVNSLGQAWGGWEIVYLADAREIDAMRKLHPSFLGMPTLLRALPGRTLYMFAPPVYFWPEEKPREGEPAEPEPTERVSVVARKNLLPGDGKATTEVVFRYLDPAGRPEPGMKVEFRVGRGQGGQIRSQDRRTDERGLARAVFQAPELKTGDLQKLGTCRRTDLYVDYQGKKRSGLAWGQVGVLTGADVHLVVRKPGFQELRVPLLVLSPRGTVEGRLLATVEEREVVVKPSQLPVADAECTLEGPVFQGLRLKGRTDDQGRLEFELGFKEWPVAWRHQPKLPLLAFSNDFLARRRLLHDQLFRFDEAFGRRARAWQFRVEQDLCRSGRERAKALEDQHRLMGGLVTSFRTNLKLTGDTGREFVGHAWSLLAATASWANDRWKFTKGLEDGLGKANQDLEALLGVREGRTGVRQLIDGKLQALFSNGSYSGRKTTVQIMDGVNEKVFGLLQEFLGDLAGELEALKDLENPAPDLVVRGVQRGYVRRVQAELDTFMGHRPEQVAPVSAWVQKQVLDRSTDLRAHYLSIAGWRLAAEEAKALKDLVVDLSQAVAVGFAATGNVAVYQAWTKLKKVSEALDTAYAVSGFLAEAWNYCQLEAEGLELFTLTNRAIASGTVAEIPWPAGVAWADPAPLPEPPALEVHLEGKPVSRALEEALRARQAWRSWRQEAEAATWRLVAAGRPAGRELPAQGEVFEDAVLGLMVAARAGQGWEEACRELARASGALEALARKAASEARSLPPQVPEDSRPLVLREPLARWEWGAVGLSALWVLGVALLAAWRIRRAKRLPR